MKTNERLYGGHTLADIKRDHHDPYTYISFETIQNLIAAAEEADKLREQIAQGIVSLCVCNNAESPQPNCPCVTCTVKRVNQERDQLRSENERLRFTLKQLHDDIADYAMRNNLGGYNNHAMVEARRALEEQ